MPRHLALPLICSLALAACGDGSEPAPTASEAPPSALVGNPAAAVAPGQTPMAGEWSVSEDTSGVAAAFVPASGEPVMTIRCDRAARQVAVEKPGALAPGVEYSIIAGGERFILPMQTSTGAVPTMSAQVHPQQPILASMALPGTTFILLGPGLTETVMPAAPGIRRVIDTCLSS
uniref:hypothetical protein n=1 Tax=Parerythrobacter lutipelagi TaxID=1964208 RepID=UPI0010F859B2|nr:hypothetical protein [Parerythrobacter lutipelagi]